MEAGYRSRQSESPCCVVSVRRGPMEKESVGAGDDAPHPTLERLLVAATLPRAACVPSAGRRGRIHGRGGISPRHDLGAVVYSQTRVGLRGLCWSAGVGIRWFRQEPFIRRNLTMGRQSKKSRIYWRERGGTRRAYADLRDYADVGGGREALVAPGEKVATADETTAHVLLARRLEQLDATRRGRTLHGEAPPVTLADFAKAHL